MHNISRRGFMKVLGASGLIASSGNVLFPQASNAALEPGSNNVKAYMSHGKYLGATYTLIVVNKANSSNMAGNIFGGHKGGKLDEGKLPIAVPTSYRNALSERPTANILFASNTTNYAILRGVQIQDGKLYQDFGDPYLNNRGRAWQSLGLKKDGSSKVYSWDKDTGQGMIDDGVQNAFTFGVALHIDGIPQYWLQKTDFDWRNPKNDALLTKSARTLFGMDIYNRLMILVVEGTTGKSGLTIDELTKLGTDLGFYNSTSLDSGGSAQLIVNNRVVRASSDASGERALPAWGFIEGVNVVYGKAPSLYVPNSIGRVFKYPRPEPINPAPYTSKSFF